MDANREKEKKLGTLTLSGLLVGSILGSGIILLPPMAYELLGEKAIYAWLVILLLGIAFGWIFAKISLLAPNNEGVSAIVGNHLGKSYQELSANFLMTAVYFGPVAVYETASDFISGMLDHSIINRDFISLLLPLFCISILLMGIKSLGRITLILSSLTALILIVSSIYLLVSQASIVIPSGLPPINHFGATLLLLFWSIIGWEVVGNYVEEVANPKRTIMRAVSISLIAVTLIYLLSTFALQSYLSQSYMDKGNTITMNLLLIPLFGDKAYIVLGIIASGLCLCTVLMILGGVTRQMSVRAESGRLPSILMQRERERSPKKALLALSFIHYVLLVLILYDIITTKWLVEIANTFFICNALLGLIAGLKCLPGYIIKGLIIILIISLGILLFYSHILGWLAFIAVTVITLWNNARRKY